jgi:hypothetical protein
LTEYGILFGGSLRELGAHGFLTALNVDFTVTKPTFFQPTDPNHTESHGSADVSADGELKEPSQVSLRIAFSRNQNAVDAGTEVSNTPHALKRGIAQERSQAFMSYVWPQRCSGGSSSA